MKKEFGNRKGFTIVELLVVIAIIAILAGAITMGVNGMFYKSRRGRAIALRDMLQSGLETYYARKGEWPGAINSKVNSTEDEVRLSATEADACFYEIVKISTGANAMPVIDPSGLFVAQGIKEYACTDVHRNWGFVTDKKYGPIIPENEQHKCSGKCARGYDFRDVTKKGAKNRIPLSPQMNFGYMGPNHGRFCRFRLYYYPKSDTVRVRLQPANEYYSKKYRNGYIDD